MRLTIVYLTPRVTKPSWVAIRYHLSCYFTALVTAKYIYLISVGEVINLSTVLMMFEARYPAYD